MWSAATEELMLHFGCYKFIQVWFKTKNRALGTLDIGAMSITLLVKRSSIKRDYVSTQNMINPGIRMYIFVFWIIMYNHEINNYSITILRIPCGMPPRSTIHLILSISGAQKKNYCFLNTKKKSGPYIFCICPTNRNKKKNKY